MKPAPFRLGAQRRRVQALAVAAAESRQAAEHHRQQAAATLRARAATPGSLLLALMAGLVVGMLATQDRRGARPVESAAGAETGNDRKSRRPITRNAAVQQLLRAGRAYLASRAARSLIP